MSKSRGQTVLDFIVLGILALVIVMVGVYQFGDGLANFFARNNVENKFNKGRTVRFERPEDIISDIVVDLDGDLIEPPVEKILASGTYIQTSGSAGRIAQMGQIMEEYVNQIQQLINTDGLGSPGAKTAFYNKLEAYKTNLRDGGGNGFLEKFEAAAPDEVLKKKLNVISMAASLNTGSLVSDINSTVGPYLVLLGAQPKRHDIVQTFTNDLLNFDSSMDYFIDPLLYVEFLNQEKNNTTAQDLNLISAIETASAGWSQAEKQHYAGYLKVFYSEGFSQASPSAYNGMQLCNTQGGTLDPVAKTCSITGP